jgi:hypothetical protein
MIYARYTAEVAHQVFTTLENNNVDYEIWDPYTTFLDPTATYEIGVEPQHLPLIDHFPRIQDKKQ